MVRVTFTEALSAVFNDDKRPRRYAKAEVKPEQNELSDKRWFCRITIWEDRGYGPEVQHQFAVDEGAAYQLAEGLVKVLAEIKERR